MKFEIDEPVPQPGVAQLNTESLLLHSERVFFVKVDLSYRMIPLNEKIELEIVSTPIFLETSFGEE